MEAFNLFGKLVLEGYEKAERQIKGVGREVDTAQRALDGLSQKGYAYSTAVSMVSKDLMAQSAAQSRVTAAHGGLAMAQEKERAAAIRLADAQLQLQQSSGPVQQQELVMAVRQAEVAFHQARQEVREYGNAVKQAEGANTTFGKAKTAIGDFVGLYAGQAAAAAGVITGAVAVGKKVYELGREGAGITQTEESFKRLTVNLGGSTDMLDRLRTASRGTVDDVQLMSSTTALLSGTSGDLAKSLLGATPQLMEMAKAANKLNPTLGDTTYMYQSLALGIKRGSPMILDNLGITISIEQANRKYAEALGKSVDELSKEEQQQALLNAVLEKGNILVQQAGGDTDSATDSYARLETASKNLGDAIMAKLAPGLAAAAEGAVLLLTGEEQVQSAVKTHGTDIYRQAKSYEEYAGELKRAAGAAGLFVDEQGNLIKVGRTSGGVVKTLVQEHYLLDQVTYDAKKGMEDNVAVLDRWELAIVRDREAVNDAAAAEGRLKDAEGRAADARREAEQSINDYVRALDEAQASARAYVVEQSGMSMSMKDASGVDIAREAIRELDGAMQAGTITGPAYRAAVRDVQLAYGLANEQSIALAENMSAVTMAAADGVIPNENLSEALNALKQDAADGEVNLGRLLVQMGGAPEAVGKYLGSLQQSKDTNASLTDQIGKISDSAAVAKQLLDDLDTKFLSNKGNAENATKAAEDYVTAVGNLRDAIATLEDKTVRITVERVETTMGGDAGEGPGAASGVDFVVPPGYPHDSYPLRVQSGERVTVTPANQQSGAEGGGVVNYGHITIVVQGAADANALFAQLGG